MCSLWVYVGLAKVHCGATPPSVMVFFVIKSVGIIFTLICSRLTFLDETAVTSQHEKIGPKYISRQIPVYVETMKLALLLLMMSGCLVDFVSARAAVGHGCVRGCLMGKVQARKNTQMRKHSSDTYYVLNSLHCFTVSGTESESRPRSKPMVLGEQVPFLFVLSVSGWKLCPMSAPEANGQCPLGTENAVVCLCSTLTYFSFVSHNSQDF